MEAANVARLRAAVGRLERHLAAAARDRRLTPTQAWILAAVVRHGSIGIGELAAVEDVNPTMLSRVIGKLDDAGLIRRVPDPRDGRAALVEPTAAGRRMKQRMQERRNAALSEALSGLSDDED
ncbi:MAG TPA: MarR family transcriptional regulator, partial [Acidothermaceae bacterium]